MGTSPSETGDLVPPVPVRQESTAAISRTACVEPLSESFVQELWKRSEAGRSELSASEFASVLTTVGARFNYGLPPAISANPKQKADFFRSLHLPDLALAHACALGREAAWEQFLRVYRVPLVQAAVGITGSASLGEELADALHAELFGLREREGERRSPLASYSGRGSLLSWLRTILVQRFRDHHRRTHREAPIDDFDCPAPGAAASVPENLTVLTEGVRQVIRELAPEDRFLLAAYFLDRQTLLQIARTLNVHEATISRRIKRLTMELHDRLLKDLRRRGLSKAAAKEALGVDPRDIDINLRTLMQTSNSKPFSEQRDKTQGCEPEIR